MMVKMSLSISDSTARRIVVLELSCLLVSVTLLVATSVSVTGFLPRVLAAGAVAPGVCFLVVVSPFPMSPRLFLTSETVVWLILPCIPAFVHAAFTSPEVASG